MNVKNILAGSLSLALIQPVFVQSAVAESNPIQQMSAKLAAEKKELSVQARKLALKLETYQEMLNVSEQLPNINAIQVAEDKYQAEITNKRLAVVSSAQKQLAAIVQSYAAVTGSDQINKASESLEQLAKSAYQRVANAKMVQEQSVLAVEGRKPEPTAKDISEAVRTELEHLAGHEAPYEFAMSRLNAAVASVLGIRYDVKDPEQVEQMTLVSLIAYRNYYKGRATKGVLSPAVFAVRMDKVIGKDAYVESYQTNKFTPKAIAMFLGPVTAIWGQSKISLGRYSSFNVRNRAAREFKALSVTVTPNGLSSKDWATQEADPALLRSLSAIEKVIAANQQAQVQDQKNLATWKAAISDADRPELDVVILSGNVDMANIVLKNQDSVIADYAQAVQTLTIEARKILGQKPDTAIEDRSVLNIRSIQSAATAIRTAARYLRKTEELAAKLK